MTLTFSGIVIGLMIALCYIIPLAICVYAVYDLYKIFKNVKKNHKDEEYTNE